MPIRLHDSLSRELRELQPAHPDGVFRFYNCGPTVYAPAHIGNFRTFVINDVLRRLLELEFGPGKVKHVRNLTDVDDRTIGQAHTEGRPLAEITQKWTDKFHVDCAALNCLPPHVEPAATGYIREQVNMIEVLMQKGNAYRAADGSVYFKITSFPGYGALSRVKERELKVTNSAFDADHKDDVGDFALWKAYKPEEDGDVKWPGPQGAAAGRPGWHIECSAMIKKLLGETIDLHTGGVDLLFPHHENEIAQSQCCNGTTFARHWYHTEHLLLDGTTMSKSKGNYYTLGDLVEKGYSPMAVRYALLAGRSPRQQLNFTLPSLQGAEQTLKGIRDRIYDLGMLGNANFHQDEFTTLLAKNDKKKWGSFQTAWNCLCHDLNFPECLGKAALAFKAITEKDLTRNLSTEEAKNEFFAARRLFVEALGFQIDLLQKSSNEPIIPAKIVFIAENRWAAKQAKNFAAADALRKELAAAGWAMLDGKDGYKLEPLKK
ncbi:MAG: cysteine--tRNA ligase [Opitutaceae bacterium]|nr:cysteine--tRNA ligase [Opitutaceae bacterium]